MNIKQFKDWSFIRAMNIIEEYPGASIGFLMQKAMYETYKKFHKD